MSEEVVELSIVDTNVAVRLLPDGRPVQPKTRQHRSRVTNGKELLPGVDGRSPLYRRYRDLVAAMVADAGNTTLTEARMQLIRRFAASACLAEAMEAKLARGEAIDLAEHALLSSTQLRLAGRIGLERIPRDITHVPLRDRLSVVDDVSAEDSS